MTIEEMIRKIVRDELNKWEIPPKLVDVSTFCKDRGISRTTLWKERKLGNVKTISLGKKIFIDLNQFIK